MSDSLEGDDDEKEFLRGESAEQDFLATGVGSSISFGERID